MVPMEAKFKVRLKDGSHLEHILITHSSFTKLKHFKQMYLLI